MSRPKKEATHRAITLKDRGIEETETSYEGDEIVLIVPKGKKYVELRRALEIALLRVR